MVLFFIAWYRIEHLRHIYPLFNHFRDFIVTRHGNNAVADECCDVRHPGSWIMQLNGHFGNSVIFGVVRSCRHGVKALVLYKGLMIANCSS
jgi:hypothetical protein